MSRALPAAGIDEFWREVVVDVTAPDSADALCSDEFIGALCAWARAEQPISGSPCPIHAAVPRCVALSGLRRRANLATAEDTRRRLECGCDGSWPDEAAGEV